MKQSSPVSSELEPVIEKVEKITISSRELLRSAPSLRPGLGMMDACAAGDEQAIAIRDAWRFNEPIIRMSARQYDEMVERNQVTFHG